MYQQPGTPRIALLNTDGTKAKTLYLPMPDRGMPTTEWVEKGQVEELVDGGEANRRLGYLPQLVLQWSIYVDQISASLPLVGAWGHLIGSADGQMPSMQDLLDLLDNDPGTLKVSPGPTAGGFIVESCKIKPIKVNKLGQAEGVEITLRGGTIMAHKTLGAF